MPVRTRIDPIAKDVEIIVSDLLSPKAQSEAIAEFAHERLRDAQETNRQVLGRVPPHKTKVDGRPEAPLDSVRPKGGVIIFEFELIAEVLIWIAQALYDRSPVVSGAYRRGRTLFADGAEIPVGTNIPQAMEYSFTNLVPYSRKIEIGKTRSGRDFVIQVPNRIYERTSQDARGRFGNMAKIAFTYRGIIGGAQINKARALSRAHNRASVRYPTIVVTPS